MQSSVSVPLAMGADQSITITAPYLIGDAAPFTSSNDAGAFGDGKLDNLDLVYILRHVTEMYGYFAPSCSDRYDAMDASGDGQNNTPDGMVDNLDLIRVLNRWAFESSSSWPKRGTRGLYCPMTFVGPGSDDKQYELLAHAQPGGTAGQPRLGVMQLGAAEATANGIRLPVYLEAGADLNLSALSYGLRLRQGAKNSLRFIRGDADAPSLLDASLPGQMAVAWLRGLKAISGQMLLLGYVEIQGGDAASAAALSFTAVQANAAGDGHAVRIDYPLPGDKGSRF